MKKINFYALALAAALLLLPAGALAETLAVAPTGVSNKLYSNDAVLTIDTKGNVDASHRSLPGFTEGTDTSDTATVAWWVEGGIKYYVVLTNDTTVYAGSQSGVVENASVTMLGGRVKGLAAGGAGGSTITGKVDVTIEGGTAEAAVSLGGGIRGAAVTLNAAGKTLSISGDVGVKSLTTGAGTSMIIEPGNSLSATETVTVGDMLTNHGRIEAAKLSTSDVRSGISNRSGGEIIADLDIINTQGSLTNEGSVTGNLTNKGLVTNDGSIEGNFDNQGTMMLSASAPLRGHITNSGELLAKSGAFTLTIDAGYILTVEEGGSIAGEITIQNNGTMLVEGGEVYGKVTNAGTLAVGKDGTLNGDVANQAGKTMNVAGTVKKDVDNQGELAIIANGSIGGSVENAAGGKLTVNGGTIEGMVDNGGTLAMEGGAIGNTLTNAGQADLTGGAKLLGDVANLKGGSITGANLAIDAGKEMINAGELSMEQITVNGALVNEKDGKIDSALVNNGSVTNMGTIAAEVTNTGTGKLNNSGTISGASLSNANRLVNENNGVISSAEVTNSGTFSNHKGARLTSAASVTNTGTLDNLGSIAAKIINEKSGTLTNGSVITGEVTNNGGTLTNYGSMSGDLANETGGNIQNGGSISGDVSNKGTIKNTTENASVSGKVTGNAVESTVALITATNAEKTVSLANMPEGSTLTTKALDESSAEYKALKEAAKDSKVIVAYDITCNKSFSGERTLTFHLGKDYAGKPVTALHYIKGVVDKHAGKADSKGDFSFPITALSPFMVVEGTSTGGVTKPVKTGDAADAGAGFALVLLAAGVYIWRKRAL